MEKSTEFIENENGLFKLDVIEPKREYDFGVKHMFDIGIAEIFDINQAIILDNIAFWVKKNMADNRNLFDGYYWTYTSIKALHKLLPYITEYQIRNALKSLEKNKIIMTGNYNKSSYDRTTWYTIIDNSILHIYKMEVSNSQNGFGKTNKPIPDSNTYSKQIDTIICYLNEKANKNYKSNTDNTKSLIKARLKEDFTLDDFKKVIDNKVNDWLSDPKMNTYLRPNTLFSTKFEGYLNQSLPDTTSSTNKYRELL
jgi:uncharacterized phage protein (TIGR02220 family)